MNFQLSPKWAHQGLVIPHQSLPLSKMSRHHVSAGQGLVLGSREASPAQLCAMAMLGRARGHCFSPANSMWCSTFLPALWACSFLREVCLVPVPDWPAPCSSCSGAVWSPPNNLSLDEVWPLDRSSSFIPHTVPCDLWLLCWFFTIFYTRQLFPCLSR